MVFLVPLIQGQNEFYLSAPSLCANPGEQVAMVITGQTLAPTSSVEFNFDYDPSILSLDSFVVGSALTGLRNASNPYAGMVKYSWLPPEDGQQLPDAEELITLYFSVSPTVTSGSESYFDFYNVQITEYQGEYPFPIPVEVSNGSLFADCSNYSPPPGNPTVRVDADDLDCAQDALSVDFTVADFTDVTAFSFTFDWDPALLSLVSVENFNSTLGINTSDIGDYSGQGKLTLDWSGAESTLTDGEVLFTLIFHPSAAPGQLLNLRFDQDPVPIRSSIGNFPAPVTTFSDVLRVLDDENPMVLCPADLVKTNPLVLDSLEVENLSPLDITDNCGPVVLSYTLSGATHGQGTGDASGEKLGKGTTNIEYTVTDALGNTGSCSFAVTVADTFRVYPLDAVVQCSSEHVVDFQVEQFIGLRGLQFTVTWDPTVLQYDTVAYQNLPILSGFGEITDDTLTFAWFDFDDSGETLPDSSLIFGLKFHVIGDVGQSSPVKIIGVPTKIEASVSESNFPVAVPVIKKDALVTIIDTMIISVSDFPKDVTVECGTEILPPDVLVVEYQCGGVEFVEATEVKIPGSCEQEFILERTWDFSNGAASNFSFHQSVTVIDQTPPEFLITMPTDITVDCDLIPPFTALTISDIQDNCTNSSDISITIDSSIVPGSCPNEYQIIRTWTLQDECGNLTQHKQVIHVQDLESPEILIPLPPENISVSSDSIPSLVVVTADEVVDNCTESTDLIIELDSITLPGNASNVDILTYTVTITDECGNSTSYGQTVKIVNRLSPEIIVDLPVSDITVSCESVPLPLIVTKDEVVTTCPDSSDFMIEIDSSVIVGACPNEYVFSYIVTVTDLCGNSTTYGQTITVVDTTAPEILAALPPSTMTVSCESIPALFIVGYQDVSDNCSGFESLNFSIDSVTVPGDCPNSFDFIYSVTIDDGCGNTVSYGQSISVVDTTAPEILVPLPPADITVSVDSVPSAFIITSADLNDNCTNPTDLVIEVDSIHIPGNASNERIFDYTVTVLDECGNSTSYGQKITIIDTLSPIIIVNLPNPDITVSCDSVPLPFIVSPSEVIANCGGPEGLLIEVDSFLIEGDCPNEYTFGYTVTVSDTCGNSTAYSQTIHVIDTSAPEILTALPVPDVTISCHSDPTPFIIGSADLLDNCSVSDNLLIEVDSSIIEGSCPANYVFAYTVTITDECSNSTSYSQSISVVDTLAPELLVSLPPQDITVDCDSDPSLFIVGEGEVSDNCTAFKDLMIEVNSSVEEGSNPYAYVLNYTVSIADGCGNTVNYGQTISVVDTSSPLLFTAKPFEDTTVSCESVPGPQFVGPSEVMDNCSPYELLSFDVDTTIISGSCPSNYSVVYVVTISDLAGNSTSYEQTVFVVDTSAPVFLASIPVEDVTIGCESGPEPFIVGIGEVSDNCSPFNELLVEIDSSILEGNCSNNYHVNYVVTVTDACGNSTSYDQTITVEDTLSPELLNNPPVSDITVSCESVPSPYLVGDSEVSDNCGSYQELSITVDTLITAGNCPNNYAITYTVTVTDECGNATSYGQTVNVIDTTSPEFLSLTAAQDITVNCESVPGPYIVGPSEVYDNCSPFDELLIEVDSSFVSGSCPNSYAILYTITVSDACGNAAAYNQTITVVDEEAPSILLNAPSDITVECGLSTDPEDIGQASASDNCSEPFEIDLTYSDSFLSGCGATGIITRIWEATDQCGLVSTRIQTIHITDNIPPTLNLPQDVTLECGMSTAPDATGFAAAIDLCSDVGITYADVFTENCGEAGLITRTWMAVDACNNSVSAAQSIVVEDNEEPIILVDIPSSLTAECDDIPGALVLTDNDVSDACSLPGEIEIDFEETIIPGSCLNTFSIERTWTVTDLCGNSTTAIQQVDVSDNTPPIAVCQDLTVSLDENGEINISGSEVDNGSSDNCVGPLIYSLSASNFNCVDLGENSIILTVTDACGNSSTCGGVITVEDNIPPQLNCPGDIHVNLDPGACEAAVNWNISATDNCQLVGSGQIFGFLDDYDPLNWSVSIDGDGEINTGNAPLSVTLVGANDGTFGAETNLCIFMPTDGDISFDWSYSSANSSAFWDPFGYYVNGVFTQLTTTAGGLVQSGSVNLNLLEGDEFCFSQQSVDGAFGAGTTVISNLVGPAEFAIEPIQTAGPLNGTYFPIGVSNVAYEISDIAGNVSTCAFDVIVEEFPNPITSLTCNDLSNVTLDAVNCEADITGDLVLEGGPYGCYNDYQISLFDENGVGIGFTLTSNHIGQTVTVIVTDPETGNSCEGLLFVEDKTPPEILCSDVSINCEESTTPQMLVGTTRTNSFTYDGGPLQLFDGCSQGVLEVPFEIVMDGVVTDVDVALKIQHSCVGDLSAAIQSPDGTTVVLFERPGTDDGKCFDSFAQNGNTGNLGCSADGIDAIFDNKADNSALDFEELCISGMNGTYQPLQKMSAFFGTQATGTWKLLVYDGVNSGIQTGQLISATLVVTSGELGAPLAEDACGDVTLSYSDISVTGDCSDPYLELISRTWTAVDESGNSSQCTQSITIERNSLFDVILPEDRNGVDAPYVNCSNPCTDPVYVPGDACYFPGAQYGGGTGEPSNLTCGNLGAFYEDVVSGEICEGSYSIIRKWTISDWCTGEILVHDQIIQVSDQTAPDVTCPPGTVRIGADQNCMGNWFVDGITSLDDCSSSPVVTIEDVAGKIYSQGQIVSGLPLGNHLFTVTATDDCGNASTCSITVGVEDLTPPIAVCDEFTSIGLGNLVYDVDPFIPGMDANAEMCFGTVDDGSYDNCEIAAIKLRRVDGKLGSQQFFKDCVYFSCEDIGQSIQVEMRVYDKIGSFASNDPLARFNSCMVEVEVFDAINPIIACPPSKSVECWEYDGEEIDGIIPAPFDLLPDNVPPAYLTVRQIDVLTGQIKAQKYLGYIGGFPGATDNCKVDSVKVVVNEAIDNCGEGTVTRFYSAYEPLDPGKTTPDFTQCVQVITVQHTTPFDICDSQPWNTPILGCTFGHSSEDGVEWPADIQLSGCGLGLDPADLEQRPDVNPFDVRPRIFDDYCDLIGVDYSDYYLEVYGQGGASGCVKVIRKWVVVDWCQEDPSADLGYATWTYNQEINVLESDPPVFTPESCKDVTFCMTEEECNFRVLGPGSNGPFPFANALDDCTDVFDLNFTYKLDAFNDGIGAFGGYDFTSNFTYRDGDNRNFPSPPNIIDTLNHDDDPSSKNIVEGKFPAGVHRLFWKVEDGCGNVSTCEHTFEIKDCIEPTPVCYNSIVTVALAGSGEVDLLASTFDAGSYDNCTADEDLIIAFSNQVSFDPVTGVPVYDTIRTFTCDDLGTQEIEIWVKDAPVGYDDGDVLDDNWDFCVTLVEIQDPNGVCPTTNTAVISGLTHTEYDEPIGLVTVDLSNSVLGNGMQSMITEADGVFDFHAPVGQNYTIDPSKDINYLNGVSTFDLVLITQHILGLYPFDSPYKYIAADANNDGKVSTFDVLELRRLILQVSTELTNNESWRFIDAGWQFADPKDPFNPPFPEVIDVNALSIDALDNNFIGVKIGDVDFSASPNQFVGEKAVQRSGHPLVFSLKDQHVNAGDEVELVFRAEDFNGVVGYQFTIELDPDRIQFTDLHAGQLPGLTGENFGMASMQDGMIVTSWNGEGVSVENGKALFTLQVKALEDMNTSEMVKITSSLLRSEAYSNAGEFRDVVLRFDSEVGENEMEFELFQNQPNPFRSETVISFQLPEATKATLTIYDVSGKVVKILKGEFSKGYNALTIDRSDLSASGILYYTLETDEHTATRKMVLTD